MGPGRGAKGPERKAAGREENWAKGGGGMTGKQKDRPVSGAALQD